MSLRFSALLAIAAVLGTASAADVPDLVQSRIRSELVKANTALAGGDLGLAEAISALVKPGVITISLDMSRVSFERRHECLKAANLAMNMWEEALDGAVQFEVSPESMAQIHMRFQPDVYMAGCHVAGKAVISRGTVAWGWGSYGVRLSGTVDVKDQSANSMASTAAHELGHVLGLEDSGLREGVMGPMIDPGMLKKPSRVEASSILQLYYEADQVALRAQAGRTRTN